MAVCAFASPHTTSPASAQPSPPSHHQSHSAKTKCSYPPSPSHDADPQNSAPDPTHKPSQKLPHPFPPESLSPPRSSKGKKAPPSHPPPHQTPYKTHPPALSSPAE